MRCQSFKQTAVAMGLAVAGALPAAAEPVDLTGLVMYGFNRDNAYLGRYDFAQQSYSHVGTVTVNGAHATGINASAYLPGFQNIYAFWRSPETEQTHLLYVDVKDASATIVGSPMGRGMVTGGTAALISGSPQWLHPTSNSLPIAGTMNINPNNSPDNEFTLVTGNGVTYTRDHLHQNSPVGGDGVFYAGAATNVRVRPKGPGNQNTVTLGGQTYSMHNNVTYLFTGNFEVKVFNDHIHHNGKAMGKWHIEFTGGEVEVQDSGSEENDGSGQQWLVFALQSVEPEEDDEVEFDIEGDTVVPTEEFAVKVSILGAAISAGGAYDVPVGARVKVNNQTFNPWGDFNKALAGNVNDGNNPRTYIFPNKFPAGTSVSVLGRSWLKKNSNSKGTNENHWQTYMTVDGSNTNSQQLIVLRNGDNAPNITGFMNQDNVVDYIRDFINPDTNKVTLDENQAIFLYELGTTNLNSDAADFQDLVVLVTLAKEVAALEEDDDQDDIENAPSRLIKVDHKTGGFQQIMTLSREYDSLAWHSGHTFYAMDGNNLYRIDPEAQTEALVDPVTRSAYYGLEFAGQHLMGFDSNVNKLSHIDHVVGSDDDMNQMSVMMHNLGTIVFMPGADDPSLKPETFD